MIWVWEDRHGQYRIAMRWFEDIVVISAFDPLDPIGCKELPNVYVHGTARTMPPGEWCHYVK